MQSPCKVKARALPGLILVLLKGQGCAAYSGLCYMGTPGQQQLSYQKRTIFFTCPPLILHYTPCSPHSDCSKVLIQYILWMRFPDLTEGGEAPLCLKGHAQIKPRYFLFNILCQLPPRPVRNHCPNDFAKQRQQSQTSRDCCRKPAGSKQRGTGRGVPPTLPRSCLSMESMLGGLERGCAARKHTAHLREDTGVTPKLFHSKPLLLINKQAITTTAASCTVEQKFHLNQNGEKQICFPE